MADDEVNQFVEEFRKKLILKDSSVNEQMAQLIPEEGKSELEKGDVLFLNYIMELKFGENDTLKPYFIFAFMNEGSIEFILYPFNVEGFDLYEIEAFTTVCIGASEYDSWQNYMNQMYLGQIKNYGSQSGNQTLEALELPDRWDDENDEENSEA